MLGFSLHFLLPLTALPTLPGHLAMPIIDQLTLRWFLRDMDARSQVIATAQDEPLADACRSGSYGRIASLLTHASTDARVFGIALCDTGPNLVAQEFVAARIEALQRRALRVAS